MGTAVSMNTNQQELIREVMEQLIASSSQESIILKKAKKGEFIYFPHDSCSKIYFVKGGRVKVGAYSAAGKELLKNVVYEGQIFGELGLLGKEQRSEFAQTMEACEYYCIPLEEVQKVMSTNLQFNVHLTQLVGDKLIRAQKRLESQLFKDTRTRVIEFLRDLAKENGVPIGYELLVRRFFTHQEIANFTGASRQTVTTILNELRSQNLIYFDRSKLLIRDIDEFSALVA